MSNLQVDASSVGWLQWSRPKSATGAVSLFQHQMGIT